MEKDLLRTKWFSSLSY